MSSVKKKMQQPSLVFRLALLTAMYLCQAIPLGYIFGSLPVILREQNMDLKAIGGIFALHLPWALKFLYASWIDRIYLPSLGRRKTWIFPLQWLGAIVLVAISFHPPHIDYGGMYALLLLLSFIMATNDIAVDGYATDILKKDERALGNTVQSGARFAGLMLGGGLMLYLNTHFGWQLLCLFLAAVVVVLSLPVAMHKELGRIHVSQKSFGWRAEDMQPSTGVIEFLKRQDVRRLLPVLIAPTAFAFTAIQMRSPLLVDLGLKGADIGQILMTYAYPAGLAGTALCGWYLHRMGVHVFMRTFSFVVLALALYTMSISLVGSVEFWEAALLLCCDNILVGAVMVWSFTLMMKVSSGQYAATGFAVLSSLFIIVPMVNAPLFGLIGDHFGMATLYGLLGLLSFLGFLIAELTLFYSKTEKQVSCRRRFDSTPS
ncbi:MAG: MFS transporter [Desulfovibrio sp.]